MKKILYVPIILLLLSCGGDISNAHDKAKLLIEQIQRHKAYIYMSVDEIEEYAENIENDSIREGILEITNDIFHEARYDKFDIELNADSILYYLEEYLYRDVD